MKGSDSSTDADSTASSIQSMLPIRFRSTVIHGFGRGSTDLGIPTANLDVRPLLLDDVAGVSNSSSPNAWSVPKQQAPTLADLPCGIYWGYARAIMDPEEEEDDNNNNNNNSSGRNAPLLRKVYTSAISMGYNPTYGENDQKTIEPHFISEEGDPARHASSCGETQLPEDFYNKPIRLSVCGYLRPELPFEGLEQLTAAIKQDIIHAIQYATPDSTNPITITEPAWVASSTKSMQ